MRCGVAGLRRGITKVCRGRGPVEVAGMVVVVEGERARAMAL